MLSRLLFLLFLAFGYGAYAQPFNNEWIDHSKTYYKFPVTQTGLARIPKSTLVAAGLGNTPAENFQLWKDGKEVLIYTTQASGILANDGFIEFYGRQNDGKAENALYLQPEYQTAPSRSLFSDTSWYYLTEHTPPNARLVATDNTVASTVLPADSFFNYSKEQFFPQSIGRGYAIVVAGQEIRSSGFDQGEGFYYRDFKKSYPLDVNLTNLRVYPYSTPISLSYTVSGYSKFTRGVQIYMNDSLLGTAPLDGYALQRQTYANIPLSRVSGDASTIRFTTNLDTSADNMAAQSLILSYQRRFNFNNEIIFDFDLTPNVNGNHLRIGNFRADGYPAILYDLTNAKRYSGVSKADSSLFYLLASEGDRKLAILNQHPSRIWSVTQFTPVNFPDYTNIALQANYLIISNKRLYNYNGHNYVEDYRAYRSSAAGGAFNAKVYDIDELADQFAFGQRKNPLAIKNFIRFAHANFTNPKNVLLLGRGADYIAYRFRGSYGVGGPEAEYLNAIPTFGQPPSDNLLASADNYNCDPVIPIGRVSVVNGKEIGDYLDKVKQFEAINSSPDFTPANKEWKKEVLQLVGGDDTFLSQVIGNYMKAYSNIISDTFAGARVKTYTRVKNPNFSNDMFAITNRVNNGVSLITYFGHSSSSSIDFNMSSPDDYTNTNGKYPVFIANGCKAGNLFDLTVNRLAYYGQSVSEKFILSPNRGAISFISNSDFGIINYLNLFTTHWYRSTSRTYYGKSLGQIQQASVKNALAVTGTGDFFNRQNCEQVILHGDPAIVMHPNIKPDYFTDSNQLIITPFPSVAEDSLDVKARFYNLGKGIRDSVWIELKREFPDGRVQTITKRIVRNLFKNVNNVDSVAIFVVDSISARIPVKGVFDEGTNYIIATIDPANEQDEMSEVNNEGRKSFVVTNEEIRPVYPYNYAIVNAPGIQLTGSTASPVEGLRTYRLQLDTTEFFNSPLLYQKDTLTIGGAVTFVPPAIWVNGRVYYWRLAPVINGIAVNWRNSSFQYLPGIAPGFGQSHFYQHLKSTYNHITLDSNFREFGFGNNVQNLYLVASVYGYSGYEDGHFSISRNGTMDIYSACVGRSIIFNVFDSLSFKPWSNAEGGRFGSGPYCNPGREYNFEFSYVGPTQRKKMMDFLDSVPKGMYVTARLILDPDGYNANGAYFDSSFSKYWKKDTLIYGPGKSLYHSLLNQGFYNLDSMNQPRTFTFVFRKDDSAFFKPQTKLSDSLYDRINASVFAPTIDSIGQITSPKFGPAKTWKEMHWLGHQKAGLTPDSYAQVQLIGIEKNGKETLLRSYLPSQWVNDISDVSAAQYPYLRLKLISKNNVKAIPFQLDYWRLFYVPVPDGALSALDHYVFNKPILLTVKDSLKIELAFKNISNFPLDSTSAIIKIGDRDGLEIAYPLKKLKPLNPGDTAIVAFKKSTGGMDGKYYALVQVNKEQNPLEQFSFNNFAYIPFEVVTSLPVTLVDFTAAREQSAVRVNWKTVHETDIRSYTLEYGTSTSNLKFGGEWSATNSGAATTPYSWLHTSPAIGYNYYRLKITYMSGKVEYSAVRQVLFGKSASITVYPNPFRDKLHITALGNSPWTVELFNAEGQKMLLKNGAGSHSINTQLLTPGIYLLKLTSNNEVQTIKLEKAGN